MDARETFHLLARIATAYQQERLQRYAESQAAVLRVMALLPEKHEYAAVEMAVLLSGVSPDVLERALAIGTPNEERALFLSALAQVERSE